jgi:hypothetical protein
MALSQTSYDAVKVLMICWKDSVEVEFERQLKALEKEFKEYKFNVDPRYEIPSENPHRRLDLRLHEFLKYDGEGTLLIIYYGGHGINNKDKNHMWLR